MKPITYYSMQDQDWAEALGAADTLPKLIDLVNEWKELCADARLVAHAMNADDFAVWRKGLAKERRGKFAGEEFATKYGPLSMPAVLFKVSMMASQYHVPWGLMYTRLKETGNLDKALA